MNLPISSCFDRAARTRRPEYAALLCLVLAVLNGCGSTEPIVVVPVPPTSVSIATAYSMSCALSSSAHAFCWGKDSVGQLGIGSASDVASPTLLASTDQYMALDVSDTRGCALTIAGVAQCWGTTQGSMAPVAIASSVPFVQLSTGDKFSCALDKTGTAYCWGNGAFGELGTGDTVTKAQATIVAGGHVFTSITAGLIHACGLTTAGDAYCWGANTTFGELGNGTFVNVSAPALVSGGLSFKSLSAGGAYTCGLVADGTAYCWGNNTAGQLGDGTQATRNAPVKVLGGLSFTLIRAGTGNNTYLTTCGITTSGSAYCWGSSSKGQVGATTSDDCSSGGMTFVCAFSPKAVQGLGAVTVIDSSRDHSCAMAADRTLYCWGDNTFGELGNGTTAASSALVVVHLPST